MSYYRKLPNGALEIAMSVYSPFVTLLPGEHEQHQYPADGWYYFESDEQAAVELGAVIELPAVSAPVAQDVISSALQSESSEVRQLAQLIASALVSLESIQGGPS